MIYTIGHIYPTTDIDSVASSILACKYIKKKFNLDAKPMFIGTPNKYIKQIINKIGFNFPKEYILDNNDLVVLVDHNDPRFSINNTKFNKRIFGIIDHHKANYSNKVLRFKHIQYLGSCSTILYYLYIENNITINYKIAKLFYYSIISDTFNLKLDSTNKKDILAIKDLHIKFSALPKAKDVLDDLFYFYTSLNFKDRFEFDQKVVVIKNKLILFSNIIDLDKGMKDIDIENFFPKDYDLVVCVLINPKNNTGESQYFGKLAKYFKDRKYNILLSRKKYFIPYVQKKLCRLNEGD